MSWKNQANCRGVDFDIFHGDEFGKFTREDIAEARVYCDPCPVKIQCINYDYQTRTYDGIYGGMTAENRRRFIMRNSELIEPLKRKEQPHGTQARYQQERRDVKKGLIKEPCRMCKDAQALKTQLRFEARGVTRTGGKR